MPHPLRTTTQRPWELQLPQRDINVSALSSWLWRLCRSAYVLVWAELCVDAVVSDVSARAAAVVSEVRVEVWDSVELQQLEQTPRGELGKWPQTSPQRTQRDTEIGDDPDYSMLLADVLWCCSLFLCATLLYVVAKIILCLYDCVCECVCVCVSLSTGSCGDALTPPTIYITMESPSYWATVPPFHAIQHTHGKLP